jgi:hypothetical protein
MRGTSGFTAQLQAEEIEPVLLTELYFDTETIRLWTGMTDLSYGGNSFIGASKLLNISMIDEGKEISAKGVTISLNGVDSSLISYAITENYRGRLVEIYLAFLVNNAIVADPYKVFSGYMDTMQIGDTGQTCDLVLTAESRLIDLQRPRSRRYTGEDQKIDYPNDLGLDFVTSIQDVKIKWGG